MDPKWTLLIFWTILCVSSAEQIVNHKVCTGTDFGMSTQGTPLHRLGIYRQRYTNCTYVDGNLEIVLLDDMTLDYNLDFLKDIREVTGYVLIVSVFADYIPLYNLRVIRGKTLFRDDIGNEYSLYVALNQAKNSNEKGLKELRFVKLNEIMNGNLFFYNNHLLCHEYSIDWKRIKAPGAGIQFVNDESKRRQCGECHPSCKGHCWGDGPNMCQKIIDCAAQCDQSCYDLGPNQCCHYQCAGGCSGPLNRNCTACRNFYMDGACVPFCPPKKVYDERTYQFVNNPDFRYSYGSLCVRECPDYLLMDQTGCVKKCPEGKAAFDRRTCEPCNGPCPKSCNGTDGESFVNAHNIASFKGCTVIDGNIRILLPTFTGDEHNNIPGIEPSALEVFSEVREVNGYVLVQSQHPNLTSLSFLRSLEVIHGRHLYLNAEALHIYVQHLRELDLYSIKAVKNGRLTLTSMKSLCYWYTLNWNKYTRTRADFAVGNNKNEADCEAAGEVCSPECSDEGCWGKGEEKCVSCRNKRIGRKCVANCDPQKRMYEDENNECKYCHEECATTCNGPGPKNCTPSAEQGGCKNLRNGPVCLATCPNSMYPDNTTMTCKKCHPFCDTENEDVKGCDGPENTVGENGCTKCKIFLWDYENKRVARCLNVTTKSPRCPEGMAGRVVHKEEPILDTVYKLAGSYMCSKCHDRCKTCFAPSPNYKPSPGNCISCKYYYDPTANICVDRCDADSNNYIQPSTNGAPAECLPCHTECRLGCNGSSQTDCNNCRNVKVYLDESRTKFNCTVECPPDRMDRIRDDDGDDVCGIAFKGLSVASISGIAVGAFVLVLVVLILAFLCYRREKAKENAAEYTSKMYGCGENEPLTPTDAKPDLSKLRLIKESEIRKGGIIGSGAFGTVYKGVWIPEGENVKIPVAIKVLQEGNSPNQSKELLDEARVMCSVEHPCCVRILAVCMTAQMMLITQLMPLGCLLDYVRKNKTNIGSKILLNWCTQIARGMSYLEERGIVHRDLAARNVLVQNPNQVKITDFGLAKLLDYDEAEYHAAGGKMPIKWLALECIQHRIFTHKTDVWSFGVTVWELFTYGQRPYENVRARDVPDLLEKGERLPQPTICTIDVYMIMIKCWMLDAESRPSFRELAEEFAKMARDPGRYLVIQGSDEECPVALLPTPSEAMLIRASSRDSSSSQRSSETPLVRGSSRDSSNSQTEADVTMETPKTPYLALLPSEDGDRLMRLPSHNYDTRDLIRSISGGTEGPEEIVEAEDYLQPTSTEDDVLSEQEPLSPLQDYKKQPLLYRDSNYDNERAGAMRRDLPDGPSGDRDRDYLAGFKRDKKYGNLEAAGCAARGRGDSVNSRYSSDPCKLLVNMKEREDEPDTHNGPRVTFQDKNSVRMDKYSNPVNLPVDEDDYLQPKSHNPAAYMDLIDHKPDHPDPNNLPPPYSENQLDNPEYFLSNDDSDVNKFNSPLIEKNGRVPNSHDYYNDLDKVRLKEQQAIYKAESVV